MGADDVSPFIWKIQLVPKDQRPDNKWGQNSQNHRSALSAKRPGGSWRQLVFSDYGRAANLAHWVRTNPKGQPSGYSLNYDNSMGMAVVKHTADDCIDKPVIRPAEEKVP